MKNKHVGIILCMLILLITPVTAGVIGTEDSQPGKIGWTTVQGLIFGVHEINGGAMIEFRCVLVHYTSQGVSQRVTGFRSGGMIMVIPSTFRGVLLPHVILGWCHSALEF